MTELPFARAPIVDEVIVPPLHEYPDEEEPDPPPPLEDLPPPPKLVRQENAPAEDPSAEELGRDYADMMWNMTLMGLCRLELRERYETREAYESAARQFSDAFRDALLKDLLNSVHPSEQ